jgi:hypothetical protein
MFFLLLCLSLLREGNAQVVPIPMLDGFDDDLGMAIFLILAIAFFNFLVPLFRWFYLRFLAAFFVRVGKRAAKIRDQVNERINAATRKMSDRLTSV